MADDQAVQLRILSRQQDTWERVVVRNAVSSQGEEAYDDARNHDGQRTQVNPEQGRTAVGIVVAAGQVRHVDGGVSAIEAEQAVGEIVAEVLDGLGQVFVLARSSGIVAMFIIIAAGAPYFWADKEAGVNKWRISVCHRRCNSLILKHFISATVKSRLFMASGRQEAI